MAVVIYQSRKQKNLTEAGDPVAVEQVLDGFLVKDAEIEIASVEVDTEVMSILFRIASRRTVSFQDVVRHGGPCTTH
jgi:hypothetical protein